MTQQLFPDAPLYDVWKNNEPDDLILYFYITTSVNLESKIYDLCSAVPCGPEKTTHRNKKPYRRRGVWNNEWPKLDFLRHRINTDSICSPVWNDGNHTYTYVYVYAHAHDASNLYFRSFPFNPLVGARAVRTITRALHIILIIYIIVYARTAGTPATSNRYMIRHRFISFVFITIRFPTQVKMHVRGHDVLLCLYTHRFCRGNGNDRDVHVWWCTRFRFRNQCIIIIFHCHYYSNSVWERNWKPIQ